jgi:hypothetical protein
VLLGNRRPDDVSSSMPSGGATEEWGRSAGIRASVGSFEALVVGGDYSTAPASMMHRTTSSLSTASNVSAAARLMSQSDRGTNIGARASGNGAKKALVTQSMAQAKQDSEDIAKKLREDKEQVSESYLPMSRCNRMSRYSANPHVLVTTSRRLTLHCFLL